ncbi:FAD-binding oxidoreductase [Stenotrophobium rhamnosiphilum]|uniref:FAD-binding oxidoreductase n=1 Tax=Stenotrophobium rhamnosiphilum TaxID=2029166 RepID=A0A2T5MB78_9GAMM|nr:FAD-binding oxidoreductase [Stenotrophobium rhamnosiphilum]PTU28256.1 FAD-binding oxidoreductase [Stenotrophobium rhamnosiphilum]
MSTIVEALREAVGADAVLDAAATAERASSYWDQSPMRAAALVRPRTTAEVAAVLKVCHARGQVVVTQGGLTGCVQGATTDQDSVVICMERMNSIEEIDLVGRTATVQAGVVLQKLQEAVRDKGMLFPIDLGARGSCTVGGNVATNAGGINVIRYGMMRSRVLGLEAVTADGTVISSMNRMLKNNAGYDLKQMFIGSEGTLGIVTRVIVRLEEAPVSRNSAMVALTSFEAVTGLLKRLQQALGGQLSAYEVMWGDYFREVTAPGFHRAPMDRHHPYYVMLEAEGANPTADAEQFTNVMGAALEEELVIDAVIPQSDTERTLLWDIRENFQPLYIRKPIFLYDVSLPIRDMEAYVIEVQARLKKRWPNSRCDVIGHIGDGNLHFFVTPGCEGENLHHQSDEDVYAPLQPIGGSISAEHGIGTEKRVHLGISRSPEEIELMRLLKRTLDPKAILNPGKIL